MRHRTLLAAVVTAAALVLSGCSASTGSSTSDGGRPAAGTGFPVKVASALGTATIDAAPKRIATWGAGAQDVVLALGEVPVAMPKFTYGANADGVLPWDQDRLDELKAKTPTLLTDGTDVPVEEFVAAKPDVILAPYSGLTQKDYDTLSKIAPVVGYPDQAWATPWRDQVRIVGKALGRSADAARLITSTEAEIEKAKEAHPEIQGASFLYGVPFQADELAVYREVDPRVEILSELGMTVSPNVSALDPTPKDGSFYYDLSYENVNRIDADVLVSFFSDDAAAKTFYSDPLIADIPAVKSGHVAPIVGEKLVTAAGTSTPLSLPWALDRLMPILSAAAKGEGAP